MEYFPFDSKFILPYYIFFKFFYLISFDAFDLGEFWKFRCQRENIFVRTRKDKEKDKFYSRFNFDAFPFDFDFGNFVARLSSIFLGIYRSTEKIKKKINSPRNLISMLFLSISILEISLPTRGFRFFNFFLGIYRSYGFEKLKKKVNSPRDLISMLFDLDGTFEISLRGFRFFSRNLLLVKKKIDILTLGMLSFVHTPSWSKRSLISHAKMEGHSLL